MQKRLQLFFAVPLFIAGMLVAGGALMPAQAQDGPGGIGSTDGLSSLELWLRAEKGVSTDANGVTTWTDQSGNGQNATATGTASEQPSLNTGVLNGRPVVSFDGGDALNNTDPSAAIQDLPGSANTVIVVSRTSASTEDQYVVSVKKGNRALAYEGKNGSDVYAQNGTNFNNASEVANGVSTGSFRVLSSVFGGSGLDVVSDGDIFNGNNGGTANGGNLGIGADNTAGNNLNGDIAEVIVFSTSLNAAQLRVVRNYLGEKYDIDITAKSDLYDSPYDSEVAGIGRDDDPLGQASGGSVGSAASGELQFEESIDSDDNFALFGHNGEAASFSLSETPNDGTNTSDDVQKMSREWQVQLTGPNSMTLNNVTVDVSGLSLGSSYNDYALYIDGDGDFTSGATFIPLRKSDANTQEVSNVSVDDGDYVTIAKINRTVSISPTSATDEEPGGNRTPTVSVNFPLPPGSSVDIPFSDTGDLDGSGNIEDGGFNTSGSNSNGNYEADDGSGNDDGTGSTGNFAGDYKVNTTSPITLSSINSSKTIDVEFDDDTLIEQTEKYEVSLDPISASIAQRGANDTFTGDILDDDENRKVNFTDTDYTDGTDDDPNYTPVTDEGSGGGSRTEKFTIELSGGNANSSSPCTSVLVSLNSSSDVTPGTDLSDSSTDFKFINESDPGGTCPEYQSRESTSSARVYFASGDTEATLKLEINEDDVEDGDFEDLILDIGSPVSSAIGTDDQTLYQIEDDDTAPTVQFTASNFSGDESTDASLDVELSATSGTDLTIAFTDAGGTATDGGTDYTFPGTPTITIPAGTRTGTFSFSVNDDTSPEVTETIKVSIDDGNSEVSGSGTTTSTYSILDNDGVGGKGPGGVGSTDGSGQLALWLRGDKGVSGGVTSWSDQSGNSNSATAPSGSEPGTGTLNGVGTVTFNGTDQYMRHPLTGIADADNAVFVAYNRTSAGALFEIAEEQDNGGTLPARRRVLDDGTDVNAFNGNTNSVTEASAAPAVVSSVYKASGTEVDAAVNGATGSSIANAASNTGTDGAIGTRLADTNNGNGISIGPDGSSYFGGSIGEVVVFTKALNTARRKIIINYLSAKYGTSLAASDDLYTGDNSGNGDYDRDVIGIGQDGTDPVADAHRKAVGAGGFDVNVTSGLDDGDYLFIGDEKTSSSQRINTSDVGGVTGLTTRADAERFANVDDPAGDLTVSISVNLSDFGLRGPAGNAGDYVLLYRNGNSGNWSSAATGSSTSGDQITFSSVSLPDGFAGEITIGTTDNASSPLDTRYITIRGDAGPDNDDHYYHFSAPTDAGETKTFSELVKPDGSQVIDFSSPPSLTSAMTYRWDPATQDWSAVASGDPIPTGKGFIMWIDDTNATDRGDSGKDYRIDPEYTFGLPTGASLETDPVSVSVPYCTSCSSHGAFYLLGNPYANTYDLSGLNLDVNGGDFQEAVLVRDDTRSTSYIVKTRGTSDDKISRWQSFFVQRSTVGAGATSLDFNETAVQTSSLEPFVGNKSKSAPEEDDWARVALTLTAQNGVKDKSTVLFFHEEAGAQWDAYDLRKRGSHGRPSLALHGSGQNGSTIPKAQESRALSAQDSYTVDLQFDDAGIDGTFEIAPHRWENIPSDWKLTLIDTKGTSSPDDDEKVTLDKSEGYQFEVSSDSDDQETTPSSRSVSSKMKAVEKASTPRFQLKVSPEQAQPLPVELSAFEANVEEQDAVLNWETASETGNAGFEVQHKTGSGDKYQKVGFVEGSGTTSEPQSYQYRLDNLEYGEHAFRLRQVDQDGTASLSKEVETEIRLDEAYDIDGPYPNPFRSQVTLDLTVREAQDVQVDLYDALGRKVQRVFNERAPENETQKIRVRGDQLGSGMYFLRVDGEHFSEVRKVVHVK